MPGSRGHSTELAEKVVEYHYIHEVGYQYSTTVLTSYCSVGSETETATDDGTL